MVRPNRSLSVCSTPDRQATLNHHMIHEPTLQAATPHAQTSTSIGLSEHSPPAVRNKGPSAGTVPGFHSSFLPCQRCHPALRTFHPRLAPARVDGRSSSSYHPHSPRGQKGLTIAPTDPWRKDLRLREKPGCTRKGLLLPPNAFETAAQRVSSRQAPVTTRCNDTAPVSGLVGCVFTPVPTYLRPGQDLPPPHIPARHQTGAGHFSSKRCLNPASPLVVGGRDQARLAVPGSCPLSGLRRKLTGCTLRNPR